MISDFGNMFLISLVFTTVILGYFAYEVSRRKKYEKNRENVVKRFSRTRETVRFNDVIICLCFLVLAYMRHEYVFIYIPIFISRIIEVIKLREEIVLVKDGLLFNKTYIRWFEIDKISIKNKNTLIVCSRGLRGKFYIRNISNADELNYEIDQLLGF